MAKAQLTLDTLTMKQAQDVLQVVLEMYNEEQTFNQFYATTQRSSQLYGELMSMIQQAMQAEAESEGRDE